MAVGAGPRRSAGTQQVEGRAAVNGNTASTTFQRVGMAGPACRVSLEKSLLFPGGEEQALPVLLLPSGASDSSLS